MRIEQESQEKKLTLKIIGRLETSTAPDLQKALDAGLPDMVELDMDLEELAYVSSAGLRVLLGAKKKMKAKEGGVMTVRNVRKEVMEVFEITGFKEILELS